MHEDQKIQPHAPEPMSIGSVRGSASPRDVFLHLVSIIALYLVSFAFGRLVFSLINISFPDVLVYGGDEYESLRFSIASLIIVFPVYVFVSRFLVRERQQPGYQELRIRKWLIYLTLFLASVIIISDLVTLLYHLLGGELTVRFLLKVLSVLVIAGAVFYYYLWELKARVPAIRAFVWGVVAVVAIFVILGFFAIGSPAHRRAVRFDERRVSDLQTIQYEVVNYWQQKEKLPEHLDALHDDIRGFTIPRDPDTDAAYEYRALAPLQFELCATFTTKAENQTQDRAAIRAPYPHAAYGDSWRHGAERTCFTRTIDPDVYPPRKLEK